MGVRVENVGDVAIVSPEGNFFGGNETDALEKTFKDLSKAENLKMVLDLGKVKNLNSMALGLLVGAHTSYQKRGGRIVLANVDRRIENVFVVTRLSLVFEVAETREEALAQL